jgi:deazaflavin-dependent oxidoreductase (nitroreductase family)
MQTGLIPRLLRGVARVVLALITVVTANFLLGLVIAKIVQHNDRLRAKLLKPYNAVIFPIAGKRFSPYVLLKHTGRRSGRTYVTPLGTFPFGDGFVLVLAYGPQVDWCRNVIASGHAILKRHGREYDLQRPELIPMNAALLQAIPLPLRFIAIRDWKQCLWLHRPSQTAKPPG